jgi:dTMP kinase
MASKRGLFVVFEGADGCGKTTQLELLLSHIRRRDKYNEVLAAREPTRYAIELKERLSKDKDAFSDGEKMAKFFVRDRKKHNRLLDSGLKYGCHVLCDRYALSTLAYQSAQGVTLKNLMKWHEDAVLLTPDITFLIEVPFEVLRERKQKRGESLEKFESDEAFIKALIAQYKTLADKAKGDGRLKNIVGAIQIIGGSYEPNAVARDIAGAFNLVYNAWETGRL